MYKNVLVTGGAGFIGTHLCRHLKQQNIKVTYIDDLSRGIPHNYGRAIHTSVNHGLAQLERETFDCIFHLAARVGVATVIGDPAQTLERNIQSTYDVIRFARRKAGNLFFASSSEVYGYADSGRECDPVYIPQGPRWAYATSKLAGEFAVRYSGVLYSIGRLFNVIGPGQSDEYVLPIMVRRALRGRDIEYTEQSRTYIDVRDAVKYIDCVSYVGSYAVLNIGGAVETSNHALASTVLNHCPRVSLKTVTSTYPGPRRRVPDLTELYKLIPPRDLIALDQTVQDVVAYETKLLRS